VQLRSPAFVTIYTLDRDGRVGIPGQKQFVVTVFVTILSSAERQKSCYITDYTIAKGNDTES
jgi:hypothetical protein